MPVPDVFELAIADSCACAEIRVGTSAASRQLARGPEHCDDAASVILAQVQFACQEPVPRSIRVRVCIRLYFKRKSRFRYACHANKLDHKSLLWL
ncbi:hypothetical protein [Neorhizobium galegae]|uniref:hypothetical protein n=1 Tax=Neorhizobium galegae TaxID=399 RepID=UPI00128AA057|nr:hypothetical protein [Neorhizobium galegae]KAA9388267.1 hypothetical protein F4V88_18300 [Neorhizobium galegae]